MLQLEKEGEETHTLRTVQIEKIEKLEEYIKTT